MKNKMKDSEAREVFDAIINKTEDADLRASRELLREYFCNSDFRAGLNEIVYNENQKV